MTDQFRPETGTSGGVITGAAPVVEAVQRVFRDGLLGTYSSFVRGLAV
ncbi:MAG: hypothetical protein JWO98_4712, partial [Frankiales bacterium]|nr:hypothetical protein [Frankiales bacterium]